MNIADIMRKNVCLLLLSILNIQLQTGVLVSAGKRLKTTTPKLQLLTNNPWQSLELIVTR